MPERRKGDQTQWVRESSGRRDGWLGKRVRMAVRLAVRTAGTTGLGAGAERIIDDGLDGARAAAALGAATEAAVELLGIAGKVLRTLDDTADIVVAKHVAGTDNH